MKIKLLKDWAGFVKGHVFKSKDGVFTIKSVTEDISENGSYKKTIDVEIPEDGMEDYEDIFEVVTEDSIEEETTSELKSKEEIQARLESIYKDIDILNRYDNEEMDKYVFAMENMAYILEWALGRK